jgi:hypothetical protein
MAWKALGVSLVEFAAGLGAVRIGMPMENLLIVGAGMGLTLLGIVGLVRPLAKPKAPRPYL